MALLAVFLYGISQVIGKYAIRTMTPPNMVTINFFFTMPVYIALLLGSILFIDLGDIGLSYVVMGLLAALFGRAGYYTYLEALKSGPVMVVGSITAAYPAIITILAITVLDESITVFQGFGVAIILFGLIGLSFSRGSTGGISDFTRTSLLFSIITLLLWGAWGIFAKVALMELPVLFYLGLYTVVLPPLYLAYLKQKETPMRRTIPRWTFPVIVFVLAVAIGQVGMVADTTAVSLGAAAVVFPLIASYPIVTILLAFIFLKERLMLRDQLLVLAVVLGIILISTI